MIRFNKSRIFQLFWVEGANASGRQQLGEADDVGERRAELIGDVIDEIVAQLFRRS